MKTAIIGSGIAGLACAIRLANKGHQVTVFEANDYPGGKLSEIQLGKYRFDAGPSLFTMPQYVEELFEVSGQSVADYFEYEKLDTICEYFWEDGTALTAFADEALFEKEVQNKLNLSHTGIPKALKASADKYHLTGKIFLEKSLHKISTWLDWKVLKALLLIPSYDIFRTMNATNEKLFDHPKLVQFFNRYATYNGSNPYKTPGLLNIIPHFEHHFGAFFPKGGMHSITKSLVRLAEDLGVEFRYQSKVTSILVEKRKAKGVLVNGQSLLFDKVVSNMDVHPTYKQLLTTQKQPKLILKQEKSTSALIFYWGIRQSFKQLDLHNIFFSDDYKAEFTALAAGEVTDDPTIYINITQKKAKQDAPDGCENWFTMVNVPSNTGQDWDMLIPQIRQNVLKKLSRMLGTAIEPLIEEESYLDPRLIQSKTSSHQGALYFCGGSAHPGGGIPLCLLSGKIVSELV